MNNRITVGCRIYCSLARAIGGRAICGLAIGLILFTACQLSAQSVAPESLQPFGTECWPRFSNAAEGDKAQFPGWPITIAMQDNDGRKPRAWLPVLKFEGQSDPVVQVIDETLDQVVYTVRIQGDHFQPPVFRKGGTYTVKVGRDSPDAQTMKGIRSSPASHPFSIGECPIEQSRFLCSVSRFASESSRLRRTVLKFTS